MRIVFITADSVNPDTEEELHGWIDWNWSRTQLHENKEDVRALELEDGQDTQTFIESILGAVHTDDGETFYAVDGETDGMTGISWSWAAHVEEVPMCERHGGAWGNDTTCPNCTDEDGNPRA